MRGQGILILLLSQSTFASPHPVANAKQFAKWASVKSVFRGPARPIGTYDAGCLSGATRLPQDGIGFALMRPSRKRNFAHPQLHAYLKNLGIRLKAEGLPLLLVGDASPPRGGPMRGGHASHQTGLDLDLWLKMSERKPTRRERERWNAPSFVAGRKTLKNNWSPQQTALIAAAASFPEVNRIFVSPPIKKYFCENLADSPWLYKLRAWWGHEEHIHVRLNCPDGDSECVSQAPLNNGDNGCGEELAWWFSTEADEKLAELKSDRSPREFPELPAACGKMVR